MSKQNLRTFELQSVRNEFPILHQEVNGHPLVYLDNAATTQKPQVVIEAIVDYYSNYNSNVHRGAHSLSDRATQQFEDARKTVASAINAASSNEVIWSRGTTESINLVASTWGVQHINAGDKILVSTLEHHSNIVPWQLLAGKVGAVVEPIAIDSNGDIDLDALNEQLKTGVKLLSVAHVSNALGTINPVEAITSMAHDAGATVLIDGAQGVSHFSVDVQSIGCDFYAFSGHKIFGPTGIGVLWGKESILEAMPPFHGGGEMIETVSFSGTTFAGLPYKFEAGTPDIAGAIGLAAAFDYLSQFDRKLLAEHEADVLAYCCDTLSRIDGLTRIGQARNTASVFSFLVDGVHPADIGTLLDQQGIAIRTGHHCAQPLMQNLNIPGTARASFSIYNSREEVDQLYNALIKVLSFLR